METREKRKKERVLDGSRRCGAARCHRSLTVGAQGGRQHLDALVSDGVSGGEVGGQRTPRGHGAGWGGGAFGGVGFGLPATEKTVVILMNLLPTGAVSFRTDQPHSAADFKCHWGICGQKSHRGEVPFIAVS